MTLKQRLGVGHATIMGKRSMFLESLHRQPCTVFERDGGWNGRGKQKDDISRAKGGRDMRLIFQNAAADMRLGNNQGRSLLWSEY